MNKLVKICIIIITVILTGFTVKYFYDENQHKKANSAIMDAKHEMNVVEDRYNDRKRIQQAYADTAKNFKSDTLYSIWQSRGLAPKK